MEEIEQEPAIQATVELDEPKVVWPQSTSCRTELNNWDDAPLVEINPRNLAGSATLCLTEVSTGKTTRFARPAPEQPDVPVVRLNPGERLLDGFDLSSRVRIPRAGNFDLQAVYEWQDGMGSVRSAPVRLEVRAATPLTLCVESASGVPSGYSFCTWVNEEEGACTLWLTSIMHVGSPVFLESIPIGSVPAQAVPVLSVPANTNTLRQYVAWLHDGTLSYVVRSGGELRSASLSLELKGHALVPPLLELPFQPDTPPRADALLTRGGDASWEMCVVPLGESANDAGAPVQVRGTSPLWARTAFLSDLSRRTLFIAPRINSSGEQLLELALSAWGPERALGPPTPLTTWSGELVAADLRLWPNNEVHGAALVRSTATGGHLIHRWCLRPGDRFQQTSFPLDWDNGRIHRAVLRVSAAGDSGALLQKAGHEELFVCDAAGGVSSLPAELAGATMPADILFSEPAVPGILYTEPGCGLRASTLGPYPRS